MKITSRRRFFKNVLFFLSGFVSLLYFPRSKNDKYLKTFISKINLKKLKIKSIKKILTKTNIFNHRKFILEYKSSNFASLKEFSMWLNTRIERDYINSNLVLLENMFISETEFSLLILKYS